MNFSMETLNQCGGQFLNFAWPLLWQSSLLIAGLFAVDFLFRRKLRASIRYALWLAVLVKLCVPPTLALPTSPAWWLHKTPPPVVTKSLPHYTVTYDNGSLPEIPQTVLAAIVPPKPVMTNAAWLLVISAVVSSALLLWLLVRWWQITRMVRRAAASSRLTSISDAAQGFIGIKLKVQVKSTNNSMSPAVCGLFRPAILIPQSLVEHFSDEQLRAVLLHELVHLRRRDVWLNFLQALLQIVYWWHPLVWLANARIRRVREEAVDDAVMLALRDDADHYAPTFLEVAKLALNRPLVSLGLVGIMESRHALRERIERLVDFRPPRQAGLTLVSLFGILAFTVVAVPMGEGPAPVEKQTLPMAAVLAAPPAETQKWNPFSVLITSSIYQVRSGDFDKFVAGLKLNPSSPDGDQCWSASPEKFRQLTEDLKSSGFQLINSPRIQTGSGQAAEMYIGGDKISLTPDCLTLNCTPLVVGGLVDLTIQGKVIDAIATSAITNQFSAKTSMENHGGIVIRVEKMNGFAKSNLVVVTGVEIVTNVPVSRYQESLAPVRLKSVTGVLCDPNFRVVLKALEQRSGFETLAEPEVTTTSGRSVNRIRTDNISAMLAHPVSESSDQLAMTFKLNHPIRHDELQQKLLSAGVSIPPTVYFLNNNGRLLVRGTKEQLALVNWLVLKLNGFPSTERKAEVNKFIQQISGTGFEEPALAPPTNLISRHFRVDARVFVDALLPTTPDLKTNDVIAMARSFFGTLGVNLNLPGKSVFYNDGMRELFVRATPRDMNTIEEAIQAFNLPPPQIHIKARFLEVPKGTLVGLNNIISFTNQFAPSNQVAGLVGILTDKNLRTVLRNLVARPGIETLAEPEVVTASGRQTQMRATTKVEVDIVNDVVVERPQKPLEIGPVLDVVPYVLSDGCTINLTLIPSLTELLTSSNAVPKISSGFRLWQLVTTVNLWDGQTAIISGLTAKDYINNKEVANKSKSSEKELLVFITATIVDPAGNRIHSEDELPFAKTGVPAQPARLPSPSK